MKIIITGGHLSPLLCVIDALPKGTAILVVGRKHAFEGDTSVSFEYQTMQSLGIPFRPITSGRLQQTFTRYTIPSLFKIPVGFFQAYTILKDFRPDVILSFGGYLSFPVILSGWLLGVPIVIHEQTLSAGLANRIGAFFAKKVCISWETSSKFFPRAKTVLTGNPVRKFKIQNSKFKIDKGEENLPLLYITGGSAGSHTINNVIMECVKDLLEKFRIIHQTGDSWEFHDYEKLQKIRQTLPETLQKRYVLTKFVDAYDVGAILSKADVVVSRAGVNTITELMYFGKPSILIPLNKEQKENAQFLQEKEMAIVLDQYTLSSSQLVESIEALLHNKWQYENRAKKTSSHLTKNAAANIVAVLQSVIVH